MNDSLPAIPTIEEDALPSHVIETRKAYQQEALSPGTRRSYRNAVGMFTCGAPSMVVRSCPPT